MCDIGMCAIGMCAVWIVSVLFCALSGCCALYAVRYRDPSPFTLCAIGMCAIGHYGQFTVCYLDVCYRAVRYRVSVNLIFSTLWFMMAFRPLRSAFSDD